MELHPRASALPEPEFHQWDLARLSVWPATAHGTVLGPQSLAVPTDIWGCTISTSICGGSQECTWKPQMALYLCPLLPCKSQVGEEVAGDADLISFQAPLLNPACLPPTQRGLHYVTQADLQLCPPDSGSLVLGWDHRQRAPTPGLLTASQP